MSILSDSQPIAKTFRRRDRRQPWVEHHGRWSTDTRSPGLRRALSAMGGGHPCGRRQLRQLRREAATAVLAARLWRVMYGAQDDRLEADTTAQAGEIGVDREALRDELMDDAAFGSAENLKGQALAAVHQLAGLVRRLARAGALARLILALASLLSQAGSPSAPAGGPSPARGGAPPGGARRRRKHASTTACLHAGTKEGGHHGRPLHFAGEAARA